MAGKFFLLLAVAVAVTLAVDKNNFKTCEQSGFCKRLRNFKPVKSPYVVNLDSVVIKDNVLSAEVVTFKPDLETREVEWRYTLKISALVDSTFRVQVDESAPLHPRYLPRLSLDGEPKPDRLKLIEKKTDKITVENGNGHRAVLYTEPLKLEFRDSKGHPAVILNERALLQVEPLKKKADAEGSELEGEWGETFKGHYDSKPRGNEAISLDVFFPQADRVYGIPEHTDGFPLKTTTSGDPYRLFNLDVFEYELDSRMAIYGAIPVLYAHSPARTVGVFWHNSAETWVDVDTGDGTVVASLVNLVTGATKQKGIDARFMSEAGLLDVFVMLGEKPADVFRQYTKLTGVAPLPPKFSLAYHQSRWNYVDEEDVRTVSENFDAYDIPNDVIWLDIEYTDRKKYFTWDIQKFAHPTEMVSNLTAKGRKLVLIIDPHIKREAGYFLHEDATDNGYYVDNKDGNDYEGWCWPGSSSYLEFFDPIVSKYWSERFLFSNFPGTSNDVHIWNDMNEPSVFNGPEMTMPKDNRHYKEPEEGTDGLSAYWEHRHIHNEYGLAHIKSTHEGMLMRADSKYRPFILTRATFAGTQRYAAMWTGDNVAEWGHLAASISMCLSIASAGVSFCGADVGGFFHYPDAELMTRWYQAGAYQPFFRAHSHIDTKRREPWLYDPATTKLIRDAIRRRYALLDLWYTLFYEHTLDGAPVMRPLFQRYPNEVATFDIDNQYMLGDVLLIRPVTEKGVTSVSVYLPGREVHEIWYDTDTYQPHKANGVLQQSVNMAKIPVYQRGGTIVARKERVRRSSVLMANDPYTLIVALDANGTASGTVYIDDGETYDYTRGKYIYAKIQYNKDGMTYTFINEQASFPSKVWVERIVIAGLTAAPKTAKLTQNDKQTALHMTLHKGNDVLVIRKPAAAMSQPWNIQFTY